MQFQILHVHTIWVVLFFWQRIFYIMFHLVFYLFFEVCNVVKFGFGFPFAFEVFVRLLVGAENMKTLVFVFAVWREKCKCSMQQCQNMNILNIA